ncbi:hypothetical protein LXL04_039659 [Taraxacum kok-saghyz]
MTSQTLTSATHLWSSAYNRSLSTHTMLDDHRRHQQRFSLAFSTINRLRPIPRLFSPNLPSNLIYIFDVLPAIKPFCHTNTISRLQFQEDLISLDTAATALLGDVHDPTAMRTKVRRLYDIANVFSSMNLLEKMRHPESGKPSFRWLGLKGHPNSECITLDTNSSKRRAFGTHITNNDNNEESKRYRMSEWSSKEVIVAIHGNVDIVKVECDENLPPPPPPQRNSKEFVFGPFRPVGASGSKKLKPGEDWENLTDTYRPQHDNKDVWGWQQATGQLCEQQKVKQKGLFCKQFKAICGGLGMNMGTKLNRFWNQIQKLSRTENWIDGFNQENRNLTDWYQYCIYKFENGAIFKFPSPYLPSRKLKDDLIDAIFPSLHINGGSSDYIISRAILSTKNENIDEINDQMINSGLPPHYLRLKIGCPIILLRNIDPSNGLCNGTRLICKGFQMNVIDTEIVVRHHAGKIVFLPRIPLCPSANDMFSLKLKRKQFLIRLSFAMTINKVQGQSLSKAGLFFIEPVFTHDQLYVLLSRVKSRDGLKILIFDKDNKITNKTSNVVSA